MIATSTKKRVRAYFLENSNLTTLEIANNLKLNVTNVNLALDSVDYKVVSSLIEANTYFLFTDFLEKKIITTPDKYVENGIDFNEKEKAFLRGWGFKF